MSSEVSILAICRRSDNPSGLDELRQLWRRTGSESYSGIGYIIHIWDAEDTAKTDVVKSIHLVL